MVKLHIREKSLSDRSLVYDVSIETDGSLGAISLIDALDLVEKIKDAIKAHTNEEVEVAAPYGEPA
jgi:hypothetical protein